VDKLPDSLFHLKQLRFLEVSLINTKSLPKSFGILLNLEALDLSRSSLEELPNSISNLEKLRNLSFHGCSSLRILPESFSKLKLLKHLDLSDCCSLQLLPESFGNLSRLCFLNLSGCSELQKLPETIIDLKHLLHLDISGCSSLKVLPELLGSISSLQLFFLSGCSDLKELPESLGDIEGLQHLNLSDCRILQKLPASFGNFCKIKNLDLSGCYELPNLPESFSSLINLEHLNLASCYKLHELPKNFGNLKHLKFLYLSSCIALRNLPKSFGSLLNLEKIDLSYCCNLEELPESIATNDKLQMLDLRGCSSLIKFATIAENYVNSQEKYDFQRLPETFKCKEIGQGSKMFSTIVRLEHLNQTRGKLHITCIENVHSSEEAERAKLCNKSKLRSLILEWSGYTGESSEDPKKDEIVLEKLQPHRNLELFTLNGYRGTRLPGWIMGLESSLPNLTLITLCNLVHCEQFPPFKHLPSLEVLEIHNAPRIKRVETDLQTSKGSLRRLKMLSISEMPELEEWSITCSTDDVDITVAAPERLEITMATLERLEICRCPHVQFKPCLPGTETSVIIESSMSLSWKGIESLSLRPRYFRHNVVSKMLIRSCGITSDEWRGICCFTKMEFLEINSCSELNCLPKGILGLTSLKYLFICDCNGLSALPEWLGELTSLRSLWINKCLNLKSLPRSIQDLTGLVSLHILGCGRDLVRRCLGEDKDIISHVRYVCIPEEIDPSEIYDLSALSTPFDADAVPTSSEEIDLWVTSEEVNEMHSTPHLELQPLTSALTDLRGHPNQIKFATTAQNNVNSQERYDFLLKLVMFQCKVIKQGGKVFSTIGRLEHLNQNRGGKLHITHIENVHSSEEAERAKLCNKSELQSLTLEWSGGTRDSSEDTKKDELVLEKLQPHRNLEIFTLDGYRGIRLPGWVMGLEFSLPNITQITLCNLVHCEQIPPFGLLFNLEVLEIHNTPRIKRVEIDLQLSRGLSRKLKVISLKDMPDLEELSITGSTNDVKITVATLERLEIYRCPRVIFKPCLPSSETSFIIGSTMSLSWGGIVSLSNKPRNRFNIVSNMYIEGCGITSDEWRGIHCFTNMEVLEINSCSELICLPKGILGLTSLKYLYICDCSGLSILPEWLGELTSLRSLWISKCQNLKCLPRSIKDLTGLVSLRILNCGHDLAQRCLGEDKDIISHVRYACIPEEIDPSEIFDLSTLSASLDLDVMSTSSKEINLYATAEEISEKPTTPHLQLPPLASSSTDLTRSASEEPNPYIQEPTQNTSTWFNQPCLRDRYSVIDK
jgi:Leucine-rich repeat (LRR) protein